MSSSRRQAAQTRAEKARTIMAAQQRRTRQVNLAVGATVTLILAVIVMLVAYSLTHRPPVTGPHQRAAVPAPVLHDVTSVPAAAVNTVGAGQGTTPPEPINGKPLRADGKPEVLYVGGEFCPYCAAQRWATVTALSRFGTFHHLAATRSSATDAYPNTPTFSFHGATYTSRYLTLHAYEVADRAGHKLDTVPRAEQAIVNRLYPGRVPFTDIAGRYAVKGPQFSPATFTGMTRGQIAADLSRPATPVAQQVLGSANLLTAALCASDGGQPASVCTMPGVTAAAKRLPPRKR